MIVLDQGASVALPSLPPAPYPGLRPFEKSEWPIFVGRETMTDEVAGLLLSRKLVFVHGPSGSGKSSLVRAGVQASLEQKHARSDLRWRTCAMRPGRSPLRNLAEALCSLAAEPTQERRIQVHRALNQGAKASASLVQALGLDGADRVCVLLDQFEEIFQSRNDFERAEAELLIAFLAGFLTQPHRQLYVLVTMRSEFLGECSRFDRLAEVVNPTQYLLPRMEVADLLRAIREPAEFYDWTITSRLAEQLVAETRASNDQLPLIQHGLARLWSLAAEESGGAESRTLDLADYDGRGPLEKLISDHADEVAIGLGEDEATRRCVAELFRALTDIDAEGRAIRRPLRFGRLVALTGCSDAELRTVVDQFRQSGVSFLTPYAPAPVDDETIIDISHEALIRQWRAIADPRSGLLQREFRDGLIWRSLIVAADSFDENNSNVLSEATTEARGSWIRQRNEVWSERYGGQWRRVNELLSASQKEARRRHEEAQRQVENSERLKARGKYLRWLGAAAVVLFVALGLSVYLFFAATAAREQAEQALDAEKIQAATTKFTLDRLGATRDQLTTALEAEKRTTAELQNALQAARDAQTKSADILAETLLAQRGDSLALAGLLRTLEASSDPRQIAVLGQSVAALGVPLTTSQIELIATKLLLPLRDGRTQAEVAAIGQALAALAKVLPPAEKAKFVALLVKELREPGGGATKAVAIGPALQEASAKLPDEVRREAVEVLAVQLSPELLGSEMAEQAASILFDSINLAPAAANAIAKALASVLPKLEPLAASELLSRFEAGPHARNRAFSNVVASLRPASKIIDTTDLFVCIGGGERTRNACPTTAESLPCGTNIERWAASACQKFDITRLVSVPGGACGYSLYEVTCTGSKGK